MNIEIHAPYGKVSEQQMNLIRNRLMQLHHLNNRLSRAQVYLKESPGPEPRTRSCAIDLTIFGESLFVQRKSLRFEDAISDALSVLIEKASAQVMSGKKQADKMLTTVRV